MDVYTSATNIVLKMEWMRYIKTAYYYYFLSFITSGRIMLCKYPGVIQQCMDYLTNMDNGLDKHRNAEDE